PGPLIAVRSVDAKTGEVILTDARVVNAAGEHQKFATGSFDSAKFLVSIWRPRIEPWIVDHAVDLSKLLTGLAERGKQSKEQYGVATGGGNYSVLVYGKARVADVDTSTPLGKLTLEGESFHGREVTLYVGPLV